MNDSQQEYHPAASYSTSPEDERGKECGAIDCAARNTQYQTVDDVAMLFGVSPRTIERWRELHEHPLQATRINGTQRVGFLEKDIAEFSLANQKLLARHSSPPPIEATQKKRGLTSEQQQEIFQQRLLRIQELPLDFVWNDCFEERNAHKKILGPMPASDTSPKKPRPPAGLPSYLASLYYTPLLTREQEQHLFRKYNFLKYRASRLCEALDRLNPCAEKMQHIEEFYEQALQAKNKIIQANLRLVVSIAKRHVSQQDDLFSVVSDGNISLMKAVEKFDFARGNKFSTYASWAIMRNFARTIPDEWRYRARFRSWEENEDALESIEDGSSNEGAAIREQQLRQRQIEELLTTLNEREQHIIIARFGLGKNQEPNTLQKVGNQLDISKERVRQVEERALAKLREVCEQKNIELPEF